MAYPTVNGPNGLLPANLIGGRVFAGSTRMIPIASGVCNVAVLRGPCQVHL
jgi:hypothetical protein